MKKRRKKRKDLFHFTVEYTYQFFIYFYTELAYITK